MHTHMQMDLSSISSSPSIPFLFWEMEPRREVDLSKVTQPMTAKPCLEPGVLAGPHIPRPRGHEHRPQVKTLTFLLHLRHQLPSLSLTEDH